MDPYGLALPPCVICTVSPFKWLREALRCLVARMGCEQLSGLTGLAELPGCVVARQQQGQHSSPSHQQMHYLRQQQQQQQQQQAMMGAYGGTGMAHSQPQQASPGTGAMQSHADKVSVEWVVAQTPRWRQILRSQVELHTARMDEQQLATRRAEEEKRQQQMQAAKAWKRQQEQRQQAQLQQLRQEAAVQQQKLEVVREQHRKEFSKLQAQLDAQAQKMQRSIEEQRPTQKFVTRKRGVTEVMEAYSDLIGAKRRRPLETEPETDAIWSHKELQLLHQLAASATSRDWSAIAARLPGRTAERCCERWAEAFVPSIQVVAPPHAGDTAAVKECRIIVEDLALRWRDAISFMTPADAQKVDKIWQVYEAVDTDTGAPRHTSFSKLAVQPAADDEEAEAHSIMLGAGFKGFAPRVDTSEAAAENTEEHGKERENAIVEAQRTYVRVQTSDPDGVGVAPTERYRALHAVYHPAGSPHVLVP
eukprot:COSAG02_NODE_4918_length_4836_cov_122.848427_3_plen_477_part_00